MTQEEWRAIVACPIVVVSTTAPAANNMLWAEDGAAVIARSEPDANPDDVASPRNE